MPRPCDAGFPVNARERALRSGRAGRAVYDLGARRVTDVRESMRVSWFVTAGTLDNDRTGRSEDERELFTDNVWTAPADARTVHLFIVLRDARGGVAFATQELVTR